MSAEELEKKIIDGSAWSDFCDALKEAGAILKSEKAPQDAFNQAEGYRYLTRLLRGGLESFLEFRDPLFPQFRCGAHETIKLGADNPDNRYESCSVDSRFDYRISGVRGSVDYLGFGAVINKYASGGGMKTTGYIDARQLTLDAEGRFEIIVSQREHPGNWLQMQAQTNAINVRQTFKDRVGEQPAELKIERIGAEQERPEPLTPANLVRGLQGAAMFVQGSARMFENWSESFLPTINELPASDQAYCQAIGGDPNIFYFHSAWQLEEGEVLLLEASRIPKCQSWNFQLDNWWMESLDYRHHRIHVNKHTAHYEPDGSVKVYVSATDPGKANWIETAGHRMGTLCWRWIGAHEHPGIRVRVLKLTEV